MPNRLAQEDSPYLQQHKDNPVDWFPWCDEAFEKAQKEKKAIFLSIGYSSCHWCHVMEHEVFENEELAHFLNEHFVSIKVDKEERPDIDKHFQEVHMLLNRRPGGWPTSIFLTPDKKPFYAATYIPPKRQMQMIGFDELIKIIAEKIACDDASLLKNADEIAHYVSVKSTPKEATKIDKKALIETFLRQAKDNYDPVYGGFSQAPKFPHTSTLHTLLDIYLLTQNQEALDPVIHTLKQMQKGGLYDLVDGGFCRYSTDEKWLVPHFEKMTYDNGLLIELYVRAYAITKIEHFKQTAFESIDFMQNFMQEAGLFYSASDADTEGEEGKYFVYDYHELHHAFLEHFNPTTVKEIEAYFSLTQAGNFEGKNILRIQSDTRPKWYDEAIRIAQNLRKTRAYPFIDKKINTAWSAMMIKALFWAGHFEKSTIHKAKEALEALLKALYINETLYHTTLFGTKPKVPAFLEDYAYLGDALIKGYELTLNENYLLLAQKLANDALARFYKEGRWLFSTGDFTTDADTKDSSYPGSVSVMVDLLISLGRLIDKKYEHFAFRSLEYHSYQLMRTPIYFPKLTQCALRQNSSEYLFKQPHKEAPFNSVDIKALYPYTLTLPTLEQEYMICDQNSCFHTTKEPETLVTLFKTLLQSDKK